MLKRIAGLFSAPAKSSEEPTLEADAIRPHQKRVFSTREFDTRVAGTQHYSHAIGAAVEGQKRYGERVYISVVLQTEPDNPHDPNAVKVMSVTRQTIGYLYRDEAVQYAPGVQSWAERGKWVGCQATVVGKGPDAMVYLDLDTPETIAA